LERYTAVLNNSEKAIFKQMIGKTVNCIVSPSITVELGGDIYTLDVSASMEMEESKYIVFSNLWQETTYGEAYWKIAVKEQKVPDRMKYKVEEGKVIAYTGNINMISVFSKIERIVVYRVNKVYEEEQLCFDAAVVIQTDKGQDICFTSSTIPSVLALTWEKEKLKTIIRDFHISHEFR